LSVIFSQLANKEELWRGKFHIIQGTLFLGIIIHFMGKKVKKKRLKIKLYLIKICYFISKLKNNKSVDIFTLS